MPKMNRLFNKITILYYMLSVNLGVFLFNIFVGTLNGTIMFILGIITGFIIYAIDEEFKIDEPT